MTSTKETVTTRLAAVGLAADRFISVLEGEKKSTDHDTRYSRAENVPGDNYGIYSDEDDQFLMLDVDDHEDDDDISPVALAALDGLPETLEIKSPHVATDGAGGHRLFKLNGDQTPAELFNDRLGKKNPVPTWGEVIAKNKYCVGAGSQLSGCNKDWCGSCATPDGGHYAIQADREVAVVDPETLIEALTADPDLRDQHAESAQTLDEFDTSNQSTANTITHTQTDSDREYDDLEREQVESMLREIPGDQHFDDWIRTAYAVFDWDSSDVGKEVFRKWSAGDEESEFERNEKWERKESNRQIDYIWDNGEDGDAGHPDDNASVGTLVYIAKQHGFEFETEPNSVTTDSNNEIHGAVPRGALEARDGGYGKLVPNYSDDDQAFDWETVTTFQLETIERLQTDDGEELTLRVYPAHPSEDSYEVDVHPTVFNEQRTFKEEVVRGRTTSFNGGQEELNALRKTVGVQGAPARIASEHIGLDGDHYDEWVAPNGTLTADDGDEMPTYRYHTKGGSSDTNGSALARKWQLEAGSVGEYEAEEVAQIAELLPQTRKADRGIPILGWFYAAPLRPLIHDWEDEFNLLQVIGSTGTGKTSTLKTYWEAFGMQPDPFSASDTTFTLTKHMSSSCGVPVWIDEYKPADIDDRRLDKLHRRLREVTKGTAVSKGRPDLGEVVFRLEAPVVVSGEQKFNRSIPAVRRRSIMTTLSGTATEEGSTYQRAFARLTGKAYTDASGDVRYPDGHDLRDHARAYYSFILNEDVEILKELWKSCQESTAKILSDRGYTLDQTEFRGLQTVLFGMRLHRKFATEHGVEPQKLPSETEIGDAFEHLASNIGKRGKRRGYDDIFLELFSQAASAGYLEQNVNFKFYTSSKHGDEVLALHMPSVYADVKRYVRDYNLSDEYNIIGKSDYVSALADKAGDDSHILAVNHVVRLDGGRAKCAVIHPKRTQERLGSDFDLRAYQQEAVTDEDLSNAEDGDTTTEDGSESEDTPAYFSAGELEAPANIQDREKVPAVRGTIMAIWENRYGQPVTELHDEDGTIDIHIQGFDSPGLTPLSEGGEYELEGLRYRNRDDERAYYEMRPTTGIERLDTSDTDGEADDDAGGDESSTQSTTETVTTDSPDSRSQADTSNETATDGGHGEINSQQQIDTTDTTDPREQLADAFERVADENGLASKVPLQRALTDYCGDMVAAKQLIDRATTEGWLSEPVSHRYRRETLPEVGDTRQRDANASPSQDGPDPREMSQEVRVGTLKRKLRYAGGPLSAERLAEKLSWRINQTEATLSMLAKRGDIVERPDGYELMR